ncbi:MarR family winged helix-turn-helix transcriptional regulator [Paractinoplanes rhizophilus]|jgi:DNA-binding MarR family transcriptional regulator|uniref:MarR family winged helix-turn-helix transcriptional regulator n=1 Tax=Paractinoplanes rhizophilus TaxID=1416877 RepID=A0ABW2I5S5_9ACTN|nr:MarR family transcriptional regulator [Actinoplanes sp.]
MNDEGADAGPPALLRTLASWQTSRISILGARLTAARMPLEARSDFAVLAALEEYGELSQAEIGRRLGLDRNNVNGIVTRLHGSGLIERHTDPADRRRNIIAATELGLRHLHQLNGLALTVQDELLAALSADERRQLRALLEKVLQSHPAQPA